jgi:hypothetical protein
MTKERRERKILGRQEGKCVEEENEGEIVRMDKLYQ